MDTSSEHLHVLRPFPQLPTELFIYVLDQLTGADNGQRAAYIPQGPVTKTLWALALTSRGLYHIASKYLYTRGVYIDSSQRYHQLRRTLGLDLGHLENQTIALKDRSAARNNRLFADEEMTRYITSASFLTVSAAELDSSSVKLPQVIDLFDAIGINLKRLLLDLEIEQIHPFPDFQSFSENSYGLFLGMARLEELVTNRMVISNLRYTRMKFNLASFPLQTLVFLRPLGLDSTDLDLLFYEHHGASLDVVFVEVESKHETPEYTEHGDTVTIWEADVPTSPCPGKNNYVRCDKWIWAHSIDGSLWTLKYRRMSPWPPYIE